MRRFSCFAVSIADAIQGLDRVELGIHLPELAAHPLRVGLSTDVTIDTHQRGDAQRPAMALPGENFTTPVFDAQLRTAETRADALIAQEAGSLQ